MYTQYSYHIIPSCTVTYLGGGGLRPIWPEKRKRIRNFPSMKQCLTCSIVPNEGGKVAPTHEFVWGSERHKMEKWGQKWGRTPVPSAINTLPFMHVTQALFTTPHCVTVRRDPMHANCYPMVHSVYYITYFHGQDLVQREPMPYSQLEPT